MGNIKGQHYFTPKPFYNLCTRCHGDTCRLTDFMEVYGFVYEKKNYKTLISCIVCKRHWATIRSNNWVFEPPKIENEVPQEWVDSVGF